MIETSLATLYGKGVFTSIKVSEAKPFLWEKHWRRLVENSAKLRIDISEYSERAVSDSLVELIEKNQTINGRARITFHDASPSELWSGGGEKKTSLSIITAEQRKIPANFKLTNSPYLVNSTSPLAGVKSCNYLDHLLTLDESKKRGFDEAVRVNERGEITSGCMANVFWSKDEKLFTPSLKTGCLAGTTREFVLENVECKEVETGIDALTKADSIFLTSTGIGVVQVAEFDGRSLENQDHPIIDLVPRVV